MGDNNLLDRINKLLQNNQKLVKDTKGIMAAKERDEMDTRWIKEFGLMRDYVRKGSACLNNSERTTGMDIQNRFQSYLEMLNKKIAELDHKQADYEQTAHKLHQLVKSASAKY